MPDQKPYLLSGELRHTITIEKPSAELDEGGEQTAPWSTVIANVKANIMPVDGRERQLPREMFADQTHRVKMYFTPGIDATMRIKYETPWGTRYLNILAVLIVAERNRWLQMECKEIVR